MDKPNLNIMYETAILIPSPEQSWGQKISILINKVIPVVTILKEKCGVKWYCFHIHNNKNGLPISNNGLQFHLRFENTNNLSISQIESFLPVYCLMIQKIDKPLIEISGINNFLLKGDDIGLAWKIIGESCDWIINMMNAHKIEEGNHISELQKQIFQFQHFIKNITMIGFY
jgi:hypothetical protein